VFKIDKGEIGCERPAAFQHSAVTSCTLGDLRLVHVTNVNVSACGHSWLALVTYCWQRPMLDSLRRALSNYQALAMRGVRCETKVQDPGHTVDLPWLLAKIHPITMLRAFLFDYMNCFEIGGCWSLDDMISGNC
jgi:hypothetical protein